MKGLLIVSWVLIGFVTFGLIVSIMDRDVSYEQMFGTILFGFYAVITAKAWSQMEELEHVKKVADGLMSAMEAKTKAKSR